METEGQAAEDGPAAPSSDQDLEVSGLDSIDDGKEPVLTDAEIARKRQLLDLQGRETEVARLQAQVDKLKEELETEKENRRLRHGIAIGALIVMCLQVLASNGIFVWYGDTNGWDISAAAISAWMGTTVVEVVSVVLVIVNYLFPDHKKKASE